MYILSVYTSVETSSKNINKSNDSTVLAFYESKSTYFYLCTKNPFQIKLEENDSFFCSSGSINHIFNLSECQKFFISLCYLLALGKFSRVRLW